MLALKVSVSFTLAIMAARARLKQAKNLEWAACRRLLQGHLRNSDSSTPVFWEFSSGAAPRQSGGRPPHSKVKFDTLKLPFYDPLTCLQNQFLQLPINLNVCS
jgi:hypothetical protein